jgi:beta-glucosidase
MKKTRDVIQRIVLLMMTASIAAVSCTDRSIPDYKNPKLPVERRIADLIDRMTLEEKVVMVTGHEKQITKEVNGEDSIIVRTEALERLGIPPFKFEHGPYGFKGRLGYYGDRVFGTFFPVSIAQAATWDRDLVEKVNTAMGKEMHAAGGHGNAGPAMNIIRDPRTGRSFEYFTEDPYLNGQIATAYTKGLQSQKVMVNLKHYVCNNQEWNRGRLNVIVDERTLREIYLPGFRAAIQDAGAWSVMGAYNLVNGDWCNENSFLLTDVLRKDWGFKGFVLSDYSGTHTTAKAVHAGLDMEMPRERWYGKKLFKAIEEGEVTVEQLDVMVSNILKVLFWTGAFDEEPVIDGSVLNCEEHRAIARKAGAAAMVLLKNEGNTLPLDKDKIKKLALIGPHGEYGIHYNNGNFKPQLLQGGGSSRMDVPRDRTVTPLDGIKARLDGSFEVEFAPGCYAESGCGQIPAQYLKTPDGKSNGLLMEYYGNNDLEGSPVKKEIAETLYYNWRGDLPIPEEGLDRDDRNRWSIRWTGTLTAPASREYTFEVRNESGHASLYINDKLVANNESGNRTNWNDMGKIRLEKGNQYRIRAEYAKTGSNADFRMGWDYENVAWMKEAIELAKESDAVVLTVGLGGNTGETEGGDRKFLHLFPTQENLINEIVKVNPNVVVALIAGSAVTMDAWIDNASTVLLTWYSGQEGGHALWDVVFGDVNPSGRLPITFPKSIRQYPEDFYTHGTEITYKEGIYVGYRYFDKQNLETLFPFGYGLSYTTFEYSNLEVKPSSDGSVKVSLDITNTGDKNGAEIVQLYVRDLESSVDRPEKELKEFQKVTVNSGDMKTVEFTLEDDAFAFWDDDAKKWVVEPGIFEIRVGSSSEDIRLTEQVSL